MMATQGLGTGGAIPTFGYGSFTLVEGADVYDFQLYIRRTETICNDLYIYSIHDLDAQITTLKEAILAIQREHDIDAQIVRSKTHEVEF